MADQNLPLDGLPALGRPMKLGMLYDCRNDSIIPGSTLWDSQTIQRHYEVLPQPGAQTTIIASDGMNEKTAALDMEASLKASVLCGLVELEGSAKFLTDKRVSERQARLTLHYKTTTRFEQLTLKTLENETFLQPDVFLNGAATHVVTGILYGAHAFFVFDRECGVGDNIPDVQGKMEDIVEKIPLLDGEGSDSMRDGGDEAFGTKAWGCTFHGDFLVENKPSNYREAADMFIKLPSMLGGNGENAVPIRAWLCPLEGLNKGSDSSGKKTTRQVNINLINQSQGIVEKLDQLQVKCSTMVMQDVCKIFPQFPLKLGKMKKIISDHKVSFQKYLAEKLPAIRGGSVEEATLAEGIRELVKSPWSPNRLLEWIENKDKEMGILQAYMRLFAGIQIVQSRADLQKLTFDPRIECLVCFSFPAGDENGYLDSSAAYLKTNASDSCPVSKGWFDDITTSRNVRKHAKSFMDLSQANQKKTDIVFVVICFDEGEKQPPEKGPISLYELGILTTTGFEPPGRPGKPSITNKSHDEIWLEWQPPDCGTAEVQRYLVQFRKTSECQSGGTTRWNEVHSKSNKRKILLENLEPFTSYEVKVSCICKVGSSLESEASDECTTLPAGPPTQVRKQKESKDQITIVWEQPEQVGKGVVIEKYLIKYKHTGGPSSTAVTTETKNTSDSSCSFTIQGAEAKVKYSIWVTAVCGKAGMGVVSERVELFNGSIQRVEKYAHKLARKAPLISPGVNGTPSIYKVPLTKVPVRPNAKYFSYNFGKRYSASRTHKVIMVVGATGAGKSTLINGMINFILGVDWGDEFRFKIIDEHGEGSKSQAHSQTQCITSYTINKKKCHHISYTLTIIDTPGFGDTRGIERDKAIIEQIRDFFSHPDAHRVDHIDAIGFVAQSSQARLTCPQRYVFDSILSIFGKDISQNILLLVTFADGQRPPVINAVREADIPCYDSMFKFNNSALFANTKGIPAEAGTDAMLDSGSGDEGNADFDKMFWNMGERSMRNFFAALEKLESKSLSLTKEVLEERRRLEVAVEGLQPQIRMGVCKFEELRKEHQILEQHEVEIEANKEFRYEVEVPKSKQVDISCSGKYITNCAKCHYTCHYPCAYANDADKQKCSAMRYGACTVCPGKCVWDVHFNQKYRFEYYSEMEQRSYAELEDRYKDATGKKLTVEQVIRKHEQEFLNVQKCVFVLITDSHKSLQRLEAIALKPNPLSTVEYVDLLIESEKNEVKPGWRSRVNALQDIRKQADIMSKVKQGNFDPFEHYKRDFETRKAKTPKNPWYKFW
ncbi:uncharacterized protein LOC117292465 [Asterias rubens]|uniref:uncharacterized protein LOC117292465 n=1 Tax=Asterias rubens TaxID=7604 RepID=UPI001454F105|nr:uncharacterized protein LOC117292465 [Asterias rubens]